MPSRALVLGGGGPIGVAWEAGLVAGLADCRIGLANADWILGTSAGAIVGSRLALGRAPQEIYRTQLEIAERQGHGTRLLAGDQGSMLAEFVKVYRSDAPLQQRRAEMGAFALRAINMSEDEWLAEYREREWLLDQRWPHRFACTAIDTADGSLVVWDATARVDLLRAIASSSAVPGLVPPITINGRRYMDGGVGSTTNAQLARGHDIVLVVAVIAGGRASRSGRGNVLRQRLEQEMEELRAGGASVELLEPDEPSVEAFGPNLLDASRRRMAAEAGERQGRAEAGRLRDFWE
jgi:NTE family protein